MLHHLLPPTYKDSIKKWIEEDLPSTDIGGFVVGDKKEAAHLYCKPSSSYDFVILSGVPFLDYVFSYFDLDITWFISEGTKITIKSDEKVLVARVHGKIRNILMAERTALNIISRASGVATEAKIVSNIALSLGWKGCIAGKLLFSFIYI
jgi:nicotinate-nucleotide pyrophosphorylase (carboxylating)